MSEDVLIPTAESLRAPEPEPEPDNSTLFRMIGCEIRAAHARGERRIKVYGITKNRAVLARLQSLGYTTRNPYRGTDRVVISW